MLKAVVIPNVLIGAYTFLANQVASGLPSLTALAGFGKNLALQCSRAGVQVKFHSATLALRAPACAAGHARFTRYLASDAGDLRTAAVPGKEGKILAPEIDDQKGSLLLDFLIVLDVSEDIEADLTPEFLTTMVRAQRFSGSEMRTPECRPVSATLFDDVQKALKSLPPAALMLEDASQTLLNYAEASGQSVKDAFVEMISREKTSLKESASAEDAQANKSVEAAEPAEDAQTTQGTEAVAGVEDSVVQSPLGYFVPAATGFALLEAPVARKGVRTPGLLHAFAEPLLGLVRVRQVASIRSQLGKYLRDPDAPGAGAPAVFWKMAATEQEACNGTEQAPRQLIYAKGYL